MSVEHNHTITQSSDDAQEDSSNVVIINGTQLRPDSGWWVGLRFQSIAIDQAEPVIVARLTINVNVTYDDLSFWVHCEDIDDSPTFVATNNNISNRTLTTAYVPIAHTSQGGGNYVIDITDVVQEVIDRGSWASGNDLSVILVGKSGANNRIYAYDNGSNFASLQMITESPATPSNTMIVHPGMDGGMRG